MEANFQKFILKIDALVVDLRDRGVDFLDSNIRVRNFNRLRSETRFREEFEQEVLAGWREKLD